MRYLGIFVSADTFLEVSLYVLNQIVILDHLVLTCRNNLRQTLRFLVTFSLSRRRAKSIIYQEKMVDQSLNLKFSGTKSS